KLNRCLDLSNPFRFSEKIQFYKLFYRNKDMLRCVDKYLVRSFLKERNADEYLNKLYLVCNDAMEIDFSVLPNKFVIKTSDGTGGENVFICRDKLTLDIKSVVLKINSWKNRNINIMTHEWAYKGANNSKIIIENYLEDPSSLDNSIKDYKFFCFDGEVNFLCIDMNRYSNHKRNFYDLNWNHLRINSDKLFSEVKLKKPSNFDEMIDLAKRLSKGFPFVRVDLYNVESKIYFGEMTFYPWSGYVAFSPDIFDFNLGEKFIVK
ncbi:glycosyltransferase, partial [Polaribacter sp.]|nr:glycosyltransferase [Polaribacter sp.]